MLKTPKRRRKLENALLDLLPGADIDEIREFDWYSATFSGLRCEIDMHLSGENWKERADNFRNILPDHIFNLPRYIVAEILVTDIIELDSSCKLRIEALLLSE